MNKRTNIRLITENVERATRLAEEGGFFFVSSSDGKRKVNLNRYVNFLIEQAAHDTREIITRSDVKELSSQVVGIGKMGTNINQIARNLNQHVFLCNQGELRTVPWNHDEEGRELLMLLTTIESRLDITNDSLINIARGLAR